MTNISYVAVRMVQKFDQIHACSPKAQRLTYNGVSLAPTEGVRVRLNVAPEL
jgi:hypothetical protein